MMSNIDDTKTTAKDFVPELAKWRGKAFDLIEKNPEKIPIWATVALLPDVHSFSETRDWVKIIQGTCIEEPDILPTDISPLVEYKGEPIKSTVAGCTFSEVQVQVLASSGLDACISRDHLRQFLEQNFAYHPNNSKSPFINSPLKKWLERNNTVGIPGVTNLSKERSELVSAAVEVADMEWGNGNTKDHALMKEWLIKEYSIDGTKPFSKLLNYKPMLLKALKELAVEKYPELVRGSSKFR